MNQENMRSEITKYKNECIKIVQKLIEPVAKKFTQKEILNDCSFITRGHFDDICEERACSDLCAYVFCDRNLSNSTENCFSKSQLYSIKDNRLYDIKRRKLFCSDLCFKSSDHLREQISTELLSLRFKKVNLELYNDRKGVRGDQVILKPDPVTGEDINIPESKPTDKKKELSPKVKQKENMIFTTKTRQDVLRKEKQLETKISAPYVQDSTFKEIKDQFKHFDIKEKNIQNNFEDFMDALEQNVASYGLDFLTKMNQSSVPETKKNEPVVEEIEIPDSEVFSNQIKEKNVEILKTEIDEFSVTTFTGLSTISNSSKVRKLKRQRFFLDSISKLKQWSTKSTIELLKHSQKRKQNEQFEEECDSEDEEDDDRFVYVEEDQQKKLERYRWEYIQLTAKLDLEEVKEEQLDKELLAEGLSSDRKNKGKNRQKKKKNVRFSVDETIFEEERIEKDDQTNKEERIEKEDDQTNKEEKKENNDENKEKEEESVPLFLPVRLKPEKERLKQFLIEIEIVLNEIFDNCLDQADLDKIRYQIKRFVETFNFKNFPLLFDRKNTFMIVVLILETLLKYSLIFDDDDDDNEDDYENKDNIQEKLRKKENDELKEKIRNNPILIVFMQKFSLTEEIIHDNLERIYG